MFLHMAIKKRRSGYLRAVPGLALTIQQRMADAAECDVIYGEGVSKGIATERERWIKDSRGCETWHDLVRGWNRWQAERLLLATAKAG